MPLPPRSPLRISQGRCVAPSTVKPAVSDIEREKSLVWWKQERKRALEPEQRWTIRIRRSNPTKYVSRPARETGEPFKLAAYRLIQCSNERPEPRIRSTGTPPEQYRSNELHVSRKHAHISGNHPGDRRVQRGAQARHALPQLSRGLQPQHRIKQRHRGRTLCSNRTPAPSSGWFKPCTARALPQMQQRQGHCLGVTVSARGVPPEAHMQCTSADLPAIVLGDDDGNPQDRASSGELRSELPQTELRTGVTVHPLTLSVEPSDSVTSMLTFDANPVLAEASEIATELRRVLRALAAEQASVAPQPVAPAVVVPTETGSTSATVRALRAERTALEERLADVLRVQANREAIDQALTERAGTLRLAVAERKAELQARSRAAAADGIVAHAVSQGRGLTAGERTRVARLRSESSQSAGLTTAADITSAARRDGALTALGTLRLREAREQLRSGLLMTEQMRGIIAEAGPAIMRGDPVLLLGETGGAKTALAEHLSRTTLGREPELVSGYGDITAAQLIGSHELRAVEGATVSVFTPGPLLRAMAEGRPVILDEVNAMPAEFLKRLNRILQLRPGDVLGVQEDAGREVRIAPGFAIIATANEQTPHRYRGLDRLSAELVNRFGAHSYRVHYPDTGTAFEAFPVENGLLAAAAIVDRDGELPPEWSADALNRVARAAFISQQVFAGAVSGGFGEYVSTEREIDGRPGLEESVIAPRTLVAIVQKVSASAGAVSLDRALTRFVEGVMHREDRRVLALILEGQGFRLG